MSGFDARDPWYVPAPLEGPDYPRRAALVRRPGGLEIAPEVDAALSDAAQRLRDSGWLVEEIADIPAIVEAADLQSRLWIGDSFAPWEQLVTQDGDPGAAAVLAGMQKRITPSPEDPNRALMRRAAIIRDYMALLGNYPVLLLPVSGELPFPDNLDRQDFARVWRAQLTQIGLAITGLPALSIATGLVGRTPVGVQLVAARYREDICLAAAEAIEAFGTPASPIDPVL
jgi:amidase